MPPVRGLRHIPLSIVRLWCPDHWGEFLCWRHSRAYRAACRCDLDLCPWEVVYGRTPCHVAH